jgi:hypothetical protein
MNGSILSQKHFRIFSLIFGRKYLQNLNIGPRFQLGTFEGKMKSGHFQDKMFAYLSALSLPQNQHFFNIDPQKKHRWVRSPAVNPLQSLNRSKNLPT